MSYKTFPDFNKFCLERKECYQLVGHIGSKKKVKDLKFIPDAQRLKERREEKQEYTIISVYSFSSSFIVR